ncbi:MAG TPA: hypothetical protein V6D19_24390 [Stenomitos sp.]
MPRLIGKQSNSGLYGSVLLTVIVAVAAAVGLEYLGYINVVTGFGREARPFSQGYKLGAFSASSSIIVNTDEAI